jgi:L-arabinose isomerase
MFTMDLAGGRVFMSHFAEGNPLMAKQGQPVQMVRRDGWVGSGGVSASLAFTFESGPVSMTNLTVGAGGEFHLILTQGEAEDFLVEGQPTPHFLFKPACALNDFLNRYLELGGSHHVAIARGNQTSRILKCARLMGLRVDVI